MSSCGGVDGEYGSLLYSLRPRPRLSATSLGGCGRAVILITANSTP